MALLLNENDSHGVDVGYWHISQINIGYKAKFLNITLLGYLDETARRDDKAPLLEKLVQIDWESFDSMFTDGAITKASAYTYIKTLPEWSGAEDV